MLLRLWMLVLLVCVSAFAPSRAEARAAENRTWVFLPQTVETRLETEPQVAGTHQENGLWNYEHAPGCTLATESGLAREMGILREAAKGTGNYGLGTATRAEAVKLGEAWVGKGYKVASDGKTLISADGLKQFRPPSPKASSFATTGTQANFEIRSEFGKAWSGNGHLNIVDP